jgi:hypothetical protein
MIELRNDLAKDLVENCKLEHADAAATFNALDTKAQNTITIAGIFLASSLAFFKLETLQFLVANGSTVILFLVGLTAAILIAAIGFCLSALWPREVPLGNVLRAVDVAETILNDPIETLPDHYLGRLMEQAHEWNRLSQKIRDKNVGKAKAIRNGQLLLGIGILSIVLVLFYSLFGVWRYPTKKASSQETSPNDTTMRS